MQNELKRKSPYKAAMTGCGFMVDEMTRVLPLLMADDANALLKNEVENNELLMIATKTTRDRAIAEFKRRYKSVPRSFWEAYLNMSSKMQVLAMFFVNLKTYKIFFDFQIEVVLRKWNSFNQTITKNDLLSEISNIACNDEFVDSWSEETRGKIASSFISLLRKVGFLNEKNSDIHPLNDYSDDELKFFTQIGEPWFLEAILLPQYRINNIKAEAV